MSSLLLGHQSPFHKHHIFNPAAYTFHFVCWVPLGKLIAHHLPFDRTKKLLDN